MNNGDAVNKINFIKVENPAQIAVVELLACKIWREHFISMLKPGQAEYMIKEFQSAKAIAAQIDEGYLYYLLINSSKEHIGYFAIQLQGQKLFLSKLYLKGVCSR